MYFKSKNNPILFIAEVGSAHEGSFTKAKQLVLEACKSKADCIKIQVYSAKNMVNKKKDPERYKHFKNLELNIDQYVQLAKIVKKYKKKFSASIWDVDQIERLKKYIDYFKIGSGDLNNFQIIEKKIKTNKPIIISTGISSLKDIKMTIDFIKKINKEFAKKKVALLHCNTAYPTPLTDVNLCNMNLLKEKFKLTVGYSDHTLSNHAAKAAFILGAQIIEKHFSNTIKSKSFRDHQISFNKMGVDKFINEIKIISSMLRVKKKNLSQSEKNQKNDISFRRSIYSRIKIRKNEIFTSKNIIALRPYDPKKFKATSFFKLIGKKAKKNYEKGDAI